MEHRSFSDAGSWSALKTSTASAGRKTIEIALTLYYAASSESTPAMVKALIWGALAYFVMPLDAIPDLIPLAGFTDDATALASAAAMSAASIRQEHKTRARQTVDELLGT